MISRTTRKESVLKLSNSHDCRNCGECCRYGSGVLENKDIPKLAKCLKMTEKKLKEKYLEPIIKFNTKLYKPKKKDEPYGECVFYDKSKKCTIHKAKPLNCKVANCSKDGEALNLWFQLNYFINADDDQSIREYAYYLKNKGKTLKNSKLTDIVKDKKRLKHILEVCGLR